jgi:FAD/FMN-containing dehydrogenase
MKKHIIQLLLCSLNILSLAVNDTSSATVTVAKANKYNKQVRALFDINDQVVVYPETVQEIQDLVKKAASEGQKIVIKGAGKSQGGQTVSAQPSYRISLDHINKLINLNLKDKQVTIEAGATWAQLQQHIAPHRLAVKAMQSYNDFSIGGSLGVNVHGQDVTANPLITSIKSFKLLLADGSIIPVSRMENSELFGAVIGGYGLMGIVTEVTLDLTDDVLMERKTTLVDTEQGREHFYTHLRGDPNILFTSGRLSIGDKNTLEKALVISYEKSKNTTSELFTLTKPNSSYWRKLLMSYMAKSKRFKNWRLTLETWFNQKPETISRNNFMNYSIASLPQETDTERYILQEYFIPAFPHNDDTNMNNFIANLGALVKKYDINLLNVSARYVKQDTESLLSFAHHNACAFVLFIEVPKTAKAYAETIEWTRSLIDAAIACSGTYYLPYQLIATQEQFEKVYAKWWQFVELKKKHDPQELFTNQLYEKYCNKSTTMPN